MSEELLPCPFCGGRPIWEYCTGDELDILCDTCGITFEEGFRNRKDAIEAWNRRDERTAKVQELPRRSETSLDWEGICSNCGAYTNHDMNYCFECGAKLEWSE